LMCIITTWNNSQMQAHWIFKWAFLTHLIIGCVNTIYIKSAIKQGKTIGYYPPNEETSRFVQFVFGCNGVFLLTDVFLVFCAFEYNVSMVHFLFSSYLCIMIIVVKPFYDVNHVMFHLATILQSVIISKLIVQDGVI